MMQQRRLGRSGLGVSAVALGTAGLDAQAWKDLDPAEASAAIALAFEYGINAVETSPVYGAEELLGALLKRAGAQGRVHVFSHVPSLVPFDLPAPHVPVHEAYPGPHIRASTEASLKRLGVERLGLQQLHAWCAEWLHEGDWLETLGRLREEGKIAGFGVSLFDHDVDAALETVAGGPVDALQVMYNVFDQGAAAALLPLCRRHDVGVVARSALYSGALSPRIERARPFPASDWRSAYFFDEHLRETRKRVARLSKEVEPPDRSVSDLALRFCLSHPAVSTVAVGMRTRRHVEATLQAVARGPLPPEKLRLLAQHRWLC